MKQDKSILRGKLKLLLEVLLYSVILLLIFFILFRPIRDIVVAPRIGEQKIVGYSHYIGYPFFIDTILFFVLMSIPIASCFIVLLRKKLTKYFL